MNAMAVVADKPVPRSWFIMFLTEVAKSDEVGTVFGVLGSLLMSDRGSHETKTNNESTKNASKDFIKEFFILFTNYEL